MQKTNEENIKYALALNVVSTYRDKHKILNEETKTRDLKALCELVREMVDRKHSCPKCGQEMTFYENKEKF